MSRPIKKGSTDQSTIVRIIDSTDGTPETSVVAATAGLDLQYRREGAAAVALTEADLAAVESAHSDGGIKHVGAGYYRVDLPDAAVASGADGVLVFGTVTGMIVQAAYHPLVAHDPQDGVRLGLTALPNAAADAAGGLPISDAGGLDLDTILARITAARMAELDDSAGKLVHDVATILLTDRLTSTRAGYFDKLNISGNVASSAEALAIQNNTRVVRSVPPVIERPDSGTITYRVELLLYDSQGAMEAPDSAPTIELVNQSGTDRSSRLDSTTMALVETGRYRAVYTADSADALEQLVWTFSVVEGGATRKYGNQSLIVDTTAADFTAADRTKLDTLHDTRLTAARALALDNLDATVTSRASQTSVDDVPTNAEFNARTLAAASYFDPTTDSVTVGTNNDKTGYALSATGLNLVVPADPSAIPVLGTASIVAWIGWFGAWSVNEVNSDNNSVDLRNSADTANLASHPTSDDGTTFISGEPA